MTYKKASVLLGFLYMIFSSRRYAEMALDHNLWINLQSDEIYIRLRSKSRVARHSAG